MLDIRAYEEHRVAHEHPVELERARRFALRANEKRRRCDPLDHRDPRFDHPGWENPPFKFWQQSFLAAQDWWEQATDDLRGVVLGPSGFAAEGREWRERRGARGTTRAACAARPGSVPLEEIAKSARLAARQARFSSNRSRRCRSSVGAPAGRAISSE